jgi:hydroxymethylglutaryl-CoA lyase
VKRIRITEVGPRDGLQNESAVVAVEDKVEFIDMLSTSGVAEVEVSSFVSPRWVPQLGDAEAVFARIQRVPGVVYSALVPNEQGLARALTARVDKIAYFTAASETFSRRNTNATIDETFERLGPVVAGAKAAGLPVHAYISCAVACPYEGPIAPGQVREVAARLLDAGVDELDLAETIGVGGPDDIECLYEGVADLVSPAETSLHLHDTRGTALACALRAMQLGVERFDATCGGLGGCPYAPGAPGNLATEDLVYMCGRMDCETGVDMAVLFSAARHMARVLGRALPGRVFTADDRGSHAAPPGRA